jgi:hypothetical protein
MRGLFGAAVLAGLATGAAAQEAVTFKQYPYKAGDKTRTTKTEDTTTNTVANAMGQEQKKNERKKKTLTYLTEVVEVGPDATKPAKLRRTYEKAVEERDGAETELPLAGKTVLIEKADGKYAFTADGAPLPGPAAADLDGEFNKKGNFGDQIFPDRAVKPGDSWDLTEKFLKEMDGSAVPFVIDPKGAAVTGKLLSAAKKGGAIFGDVAVSADLPLTEVRGKAPVKLNPGSFWKIEMKGSGCFDGTSPDGGSVGTMKMSLDGAVMGVALKVESDVKLTSRTERVTDGKR